MPINTDIKNMVNASDNKAQYDEKAKHLLGNKMILAYILVNTVDEFQGMTPEDAMPYIEGELIIGTVPVESGLTNTQREEKG